MVEKRKPQAPQAFDIHRNLPNHPGQLARHHGQPEIEVEKHPKRKRTWKSYLKRGLLTLIAVSIVAFVIIAIWDARNISAATKQIFGSTNLVALVRGGALKTDSHGRVNMLIVGDSADDPGHPGADLTDSILLLSMNPANHTGYLLSIPRDLYVAIPGHDYGKINSAYEYVGISGLEKIIASDLTVDINYYAVVDYGAVRDIVNALGGIKINISSSDPRGLYDPNIFPIDGGPLKLSNGPQTLNGQTALNLTRARGETYNSYGFPQSDFDRTQHQRQVFTAIKNKLNWHLFLNPRKNSTILNAIAKNVKTDLQIGEARPMFGVFNSIPNSQLKSVSLNDFNGHDLLQNYDSYYSGSALVPAAGITDFSQIDNAIQQLNQ